MTAYAENLQKAGHSADFALADLRAALHDASELEALVLLPLVGRAATLTRDIGALRQARGDR